jgi:SAM-dependent methyltransferase
MKRDYFDELAARWDSIPRPPDAPARVERFLDAVLPPVCRRILDAGCGTGILTPGLLRRLGPDGTLVELDYAHAMLVENRRKRAASDPVRYVCGDAAAPALKPGAFDAVLCFGLLPHLESLEAGLRALLALARPGGRLAAGHLMSSALLNDLHASIGGPVGHDRLPSADELGRCLEALGARVVCAEDRPDGYVVAAEIAS